MRVITMVNVYLELATDVRSGI